MEDAVRRSLAIFAGDNYQGRFFGNGGARKQTRTHGAAEEAKQVGFPGDAVALGNNAEDQTTVEHDDHDGDEERVHAPFEITAKYEETKVAKDQPAGADIHGTGRTEEPDNETDKKAGSNRNDYKVGDAPPYNEPTEDYKGQGIGEEMLHSGVEKGHQKDTPNTRLAAR